MSGLFDRLLGRSSKNIKTGSVTAAKERLQFVLVHDRVNMSPERMKAMKEEILAVISKYVAVSGSEIEIALQQRDRNSNLLIAEIPFSKSLPTPLSRTLNDVDEAAHASHDEDDDRHPVKSPDSESLISAKAENLSVPKSQNSTTEDKKAENADQDK